MSAIYACLAERRVCCALYNHRNIYTSECTCYGDIVFPDVWKFDIHALSYFSYSIPFVVNPRSLCFVYAKLFRFVSFEIWLKSDREVTAVITRKIKQSRMIRAFNRINRKSLRYTLNSFQSPVKFLLEAFHFT